MNIEVEVTKTKEYFEKYYSDWLKRSNLKWQPLIGVAYIFVGIFIYSFTGYERMKDFSIVLLFWGIYQFYQYFMNKKTWMKERMDSKLLRKKLTLIFKDEYIEHSGPYSNGTLKWETFQKYFLTDNGFTLKPENGIIIFLPRTAFKNKEDILQIEKKLKSVIAKK